MGIDVSALGLMLRSRDMGVSFENSVTIGRQRMYIKPRQLNNVRDNLIRYFGPDELKRIEEALDHPSGFFEPLFEALGATETDSLDNSPYENATIIHDMNSEIPVSLQEKYSLVYDGGCLEHIFNYPAAIKNCMNLVRRDGHFITMTTANNFCGHGFYQFSPELLFRVLNEDNGFVVREAFLVESLPERIRCFKVPDPDVLKKRVDVRNTTPLLLWVLAQRVEVKDVLASPPMQSDYAKTWANEDESHVDHLVALKTRNPQASWRDPLFNVLPGGAVSFLRRLRDAVRDPMAGNPDLSQVDVFSDLRS